MNAAVKPDVYQQTAREIQLVNRRSEVFEIEQLRRQEGIDDDRLSTTYATLLEQIQLLVERDLKTILANHSACDDAETGRLVHQCIGGYALRVQRAREARERLQDEFLPSWRKRAEP
jgi:hypothetical protein